MFRTSHHDDAKASVVGATGSFFIDLSTSFDTSEKYESPNELNPALRGSVHCLEGRALDIGPPGVS